MYEKAPANIHVGAPMSYGNLASISNMQAFLKKLLEENIKGQLKGADFFVEGSSSLAGILKVPSVIIGLTIVAFGTSAPEMAVSISASIAGSNDIAVGNVIGSNIFNLLMVIGICGLILPMKIDKSILYGDFLFTIVAAVVMLLLFAFDCNLSRWNGLEWSGASGHVCILYV